MSKCDVCGNVNYDEDGKPTVCIRCNWKDYDKWYGVRHDDAVSSPDWKGFGWLCPVCGNHNSGEFPSCDVCPSCGWEQDEVQHEDHDYSGGANDESVGEAKAAWEKRKS